ncbi:MAG: DUF349 domain-containing protein [Flavobacteriales bacterium]
MQVGWKNSILIISKPAKKIWKRFQTDCNRFFDRYKANHTLKEEECNKNYDKKLKFMTQLKEFQLPS